MGYGSAVEHDGLPPAIGESSTGRMSTSTLKKDFQRLFH